MLYVLFILGLILLAFGGDTMVNGSVGVAKKLKVFVESTFVRDFMLYFLVKKHQIACNRYSYVIYLYVE